MPRRDAGSPLPPNMQAESPSAGGSCARLPAPAPEYAAEVRALSLARQAALALQIHPLHPGVCKKVGPLLFMYVGWLLWTVVAPVALLVFTDANPSVANAEAMRVVGWCLLGSGAVVLLWALLPVLTVGGICMPRPPPNDGPFIREPLAVYHVDEDAAATSTAPPENSTARSLLQPQPASWRVDVRGRCVYVIHNEFGAHGATAKVKAAMCVERLKQAGACVHTLVTQYSQHLVDLGRDPQLLPLEHAGSASSSSSSSSSASASSASSSVAAIVLIGGDGSLSELINGYMARCAEQGIPPERRTPICLIPGGTGNSFARDLYTVNLDPGHALDCLLGKGAIKLVDLSELRDEAGWTMFSSNTISWGLVGDTAVVAEYYRWLGDARYDVCALWFVLRQITSRGRFLLRNLGGKFNFLQGKPIQLDTQPSHLPIVLDPEAKAGPRARLLSNNSAPAPRPNGGPSSSASTSVSVSSSNVRAVLETAGEKTTAFFNQTQHFAKALRACPHAKLDDGLIDVIIGSGDLARRNLLAMLQQLGKGAHLRNEAVTHVQVQEIVLSPVEEPKPHWDLPPGNNPRTLRATAINVDGENRVIQGTLHVRCRTRQIPVFAPLD